jgi:phosphocarrier protein HPr
VSRAVTPSGWHPISCGERKRDLWELVVGKWEFRSVTTRSVMVVNQLGLHARAAARFVHLATRFESRIRVGCDSKVMDGKSIMGILLLAASRGTTLTVIAEGPDEDRAVAALVELVEAGFGEESWSV